MQAPSERHYLAPLFEPASVAIIGASERNGIDWKEFPRLKAWFDRIADRPAVQRGLNVLSQQVTPAGQYDPKAREVLFGAAQYQRRN